MRTEKINKHMNVRDIEFFDTELDEEIVYLNRKHIILPHRLRGGCYQRFDILNQIINIQMN